MWRKLSHGSFLHAAPIIMAQKSITSFFKPRPTESNTKRNICGDEGDDQSTPNKKRVLDINPTLSPSLSSNGSTQKNILLPLVASSVGSTWHRALQDEFSKPYFIELSKFLANERKQYTVYPPPEEVFSWTQFCDIQKVKVIILGQDPYHGPNQAHGLAFSVKKGVAQPPSLVNIFKEVKNDYLDFEIPKHGDLTSWAKQGVLLLNACLTVRAHNANSHANRGWEKLTDAVIKYLNQHCANRVFLLWGSYAQKKGSVIDKSKHLVLKNVHPSPLSAHRGFFGCSHFKSANEYLAKHDLTPIDWTRLD